MLSLGITGAEVEEMVQWTVQLQLQQLDQECHAKYNTRIVELETIATNLYAWKQQVATREAEIVQMQEHWQLAREGGLAGILSA